MEIGNAKISFLGHSGFLIEHGRGKRIAIDPYNLTSDIGKVDAILVTHTHYDHCSIKDISKIARHGTLVIVPADAQSKITKVKNVEMHVVEVGEEFSIGGLKIEAVPAYTLDKTTHPKKEGWFGFIVKIGSTIIYHAGDTGKIPEMNRLTGYGKDGNLFIALLPVSGQFVMDAEEAVEVAGMLKPDYAIPMHYGAGVAGALKDAEKFIDLCKQKNINGIILEKI